MDAALVETHVSVVVFVGDHVYKLKKPVRFPFADLSTREAREAMCHREVELNRRLARDVYEGVIDLVGPDGEVCDHLVAMRRMPDDRRLARLIVERDRRAGPAMDAIARVLARFHDGADRSPEISSAATPDAVLERWRRNDAQMRPFVGSCFERGDLDRVRDLVDRFVEGRHPLFEQRIADGQICDGHGDLLADDVFLLDDGPRILDCIEFDDRLRHVDVIDDLAFLAMDVERLGAPHLAAALVVAYERASGSAAPAGLLDLYVAYRAQVRAMVAALRSSQDEDAASRATHEADARTLLARCLRHLDSATVRLVVVGGLPGTGKTTVARGIADRTGWLVLRSDELRKRLTGRAPETPAAAPFGEGIYTAELSDRTYEAMLDAARESLVAGRSVVLDASFTADRHRVAARALAEETASELVEIQCTVAADEAARRMWERHDLGLDASDADPIVAARLAQVSDPWPGCTVLPTERPIGAVVDDAIAIAGAVSLETAGPEV